MSGNDQFDISGIFGGDQSRQSRASSFFTNFIYENFLDLLTNNLNWWYDGGHLLKSMEAIRSKCDGNEHLST